MCGSGLFSVWLSNAHGLLDSGCVEKLGGVFWLNEYPTEKESLFQQADWDCT
jgi:hypothetical protein